MGDVARQIFHARSDEEHPQIRLEQSFEHALEVLAHGLVQADEWLIENKESEWLRQRARQLDPLPFAIGQRKQRAGHKGAEIQQLNHPLPPPLKRRLGDSVLWGHFEWVDLHYPLIRKKIPDQQRAFLLETGPAGLDDHAAQFGFAILKGDMANGFLGA